MPTEPRLRIAIPKQEKLKFPVLSYLEERGFDLSNDDGETGILSDRNRDIPNIRVEFVRAADALLLLDKQVVDLAVIGSDIVDENTAGKTPRFVKPVMKIDLGIAQCRFKVAVPNGKSEQFQTPSDLNGLRIATSYPNILQAWLDKNNTTPSEVITRDGGVESSIRMGFADAVADLVDTGGTLRKYQLTGVFDIARTSAMIYAPQSVECMSSMLADEFLRHLRLNKRNASEQPRLLEIA